MIYNNYAMTLLMLFGAPLGVANGCCFTPINCMYTAITNKPESSITSVLMPPTLPTIPCGCMLFTCIARYYTMMLLEVTDVRYACGP